MVCHQDLNKALQKALEDWRHKPLHPGDYCQVWLGIKHNISSTDWGYRKKCLYELERELGLSTKTIKKWGTDFERCQDRSTLLSLRRAHILNIYALVDSSSQSMSNTERLQRVLQQLETLEALITFHENTPEPATEADPFENWQTFAVC